MTAMAQGPGSACRHGICCLLDVGDADREVPRQALHGIAVPPGTGQADSYGRRGFFCRGVERCSSAFSWHPTKPDTSLDEHGTRRSKHDRRLDQV